MKHIGKWLPPLMLCALVAIAGSVGWAVLRWLRLWWAQAPGWLFWPLWVTPPVAFALCGSLPRGPARSAARRLGECWFSLAIYPYLYTLLAMLLGRVLWLAGRALPLAPAGWVVLGLSAGTVALGCYLALHPRVVTYRVEVAAPCRPLRLALLSDLHMGAFTPRGQLPRLAARCNSLRPDAVVIAGDLFDEEYAALRHPREAAAALASLESPLGTFACQGNHDLYCPGPEQDALLSEGRVRVLKDECVALGDVTLWGRRDLRARKRLTPQALLEGATGPVVVLDHNPSGSAALLDAGADVVLCGHTHNGQTFPGNLFIRLLPWPVYGLHRRGGGVCIVTSGAGIWGFPLRIGARTEVVCVELSGRPGTGLPS